MDMKTGASFAAPPALLQAVVRLLRPLARLLMAHGVSFPAFSEMAKGVYVDVAARDFHDDGEPVTYSRVSVLSGVHRRDVKRLRAEYLHQFQTPPVVSFGALVVARWCADPRYQDHLRRPAPLPRLSRWGGEASFEKLVEGVSKDIRARAVLEEWLRLGVAELDEDDRVHLKESARTISLDRDFWLEFARICKLSAEKSDVSPSGMVKIALSVMSSMIMDGIDAEVKREKNNETYARFLDCVVEIMRKTELDQARKGQIIHDEASRITSLMEKCVAL